MLLELLENINLIPLYTIVTFLAVILCIDNIALVALRRIGREDPSVFHWMRRVALIILALALLLSLSYSQDKGWQPWGADLITRLAICAWLATSSIAVRYRDRQGGRINVDPCVNADFIARQNPRTIRAIKRRA